jgi:hypothetical protein
MQLHRNTAKIRRSMLIVLALGLLALFTPALLGLIGREFFLGPWACYVVGAIIAIVAIYGLLNTLRPFHLEVTDAGLSVRADSLTTTLPWTSVAALTIERDPGANSNAPPNVMLWLSEDTDVGAKAARKNDGRAGYRLLSLNDFKEPAGQVVDVLRRYAGDKLVVVDVPGNTRS